MIVVETIEFRELVELFLNTSLSEIKKESDTPNINFKFKEDGLDLFKDIVANPFVKKDFWTPDAKQEDIDFLLSHNNNDDDVPTIYINDSIKFFEILTNIINSTLELYAEYGMRLSARNLAMQILRRIWLRMGVEDISNIDIFLDKQLQFVRNRAFDNHKIEKVNMLNEYEVFMTIDVNQTWDESTRSMIFTIKGNDSTYELPHILFDIDDNGICYIYAVQSSKKEKDKTIEKELYKINKNFEEPNVPPS